MNIAIVARLLLVDVKKCFQFCKLRMLVTLKLLKPVLIRTSKNQKEVGINYIYYKY